MKVKFKNGVMMPNIFGLKKEAREMKNRQFGYIQCANYVR